jgi:hypothetical protein
VSVLTVRKCWRARGSGTSIILRDAIDIVGSKLIATPLGANLDTFRVSGDSIPPKRHFTLFEIP